jgi:hypothetical protein
MRSPVYDLTAPSSARQRDDRFAAERPLMTILHIASTLLAGDLHGRAVV